MAKLLFTFIFLLGSQAYADVPDENSPCSNIQFEEIHIPKDCGSEKRSQKFSFNRDTDRKKQQLIVKKDKGCFVKLKYEGAYYRTNPELFELPDLFFSQNCLGYQEKEKYEFENWPRRCFIRIAHRLNVCGCYYQPKKLHKPKCLPEPRFQSRTDRFNRKYRSEKRFFEKTSGVSYLEEDLEYAY